MIDPTQLQMLALLVITVFVLVVLVLVGGSIALTVTKMLEFRREKKRAADEKYRRTHRSDGRPYPPSARGLCDHCHRSCDKVYYLPSGRRLCPDCYEQLDPERPRGVAGSHGEMTEESS